MATFPALPPTRPLTDRITIALAALRQARFDGSATRIYVAQRRFDHLVDQLPTPTAQE
jgi:hypothetical protein